MAEELAVHGAGVEEHPAPGRRGVLVRRGAFGVKREVFAVAKMSAPARRLLRKRLGAELDAVRDAIRKAELLPCRSGGVTGAGAPAGKDGGRVSAADAPAEAEEDGGRAAKKRKASPFSKQGAGEPKRMRPDDRERLAGRLASLAAALPDHVVAFLQNSPSGGADSGGDGGGIEMGAVPMKGGALSQLKMLLDKFAPESTPKSQGRAPPVVASGGKLATVQEEEEDDDDDEEEGVDICRGVSRITIRDIAEEYGDLVDDMGIQLLSPLQRKYVDLAEQGEYVDICGDASPVVFPAKAGDSSSSSSSSSDSDSSSSDSDSDSSSSSDSDSDSGSDDPGRSVTSRSPPAILPIEKDAADAQPPEAVQTAEPEGVQDQCAPPVLTTLRITASPPAPEPAQETVLIAEKGELQVQSTVQETVQPVTTTSIPSAPAALPEEVQIAEPKELQHQCVAPAATVHPSPGGAPPSAVLPEAGNGAPSQQPPEVAPVAAQIGEPQQALQLEDAAPAPAPVPGDDNTDPVAIAREAAERLWQLAKERAKAKARQVLLETERAALPDERVYPRDLEQLGIAAFEHVASTVQGARTAAAQPQVNGGDGGGLRVSPGAPSILQQLGLFLKDDGAGDDDDDEEEEPPLPRPTGRFASHGEESEAEDGEIR